MSAPEPKQLLEQARHLVRREKLRPRQVSLRRAVSAAYYALFHLLVQESARSLGRSDPRLQMLIACAFSHEEMKKACQAFASPGTAPAIIGATYPSLAVPTELANVAQSFVELQKARHDADYATHRRWTRTMAQKEVEHAEQAFADWQKIRPRPKSKAAASAATALPATTTEAVRLFLAWLALQRALQGRSS